LLHHRPLPRAVQLRRSDPANRRAGEGPAATAASDSPRGGAAAPRGQRPARHPGKPPRPGRVPGRGDPRGPPGHAVRAVPLGRQRGRQSADQPGPRPGQPDARVQAGGRPNRRRCAGGEAMKKRLVVVGNGMAAGRLLDDLLRRNAHTLFDIAVYGEEPHGCYNRILLGRIIGGGSAEEITLKSCGWYADRGVTFHAGTTIARLDTTARMLHTAGGDTHPYDVAVFATGSRPLVPPLDGLRTADGQPKPGAFVFRTVDDCERLRAAARPGCSAVVLGGGLLGLEAAKALCDLGLHVTVVHLADTLMNLQVDAPGGAFLRKAVERTGIFVRTGVAATGLRGEGRVTGVVLKSGEVLPADLVVLACGIRPRVEAALASGVPVKTGIVVNDLLATAVPGVFAVGECAE